MSLLSWIKPLRFKNNYNYKHNYCLVHLCYLVATSTGSKLQLFQRCEWECECTPACDVRRLGMNLLAFIWLLHRSSSILVNVSLFCVSLALIVFSKAFQNVWHPCFNFVVAANVKSSFSRRRNGTVWLRIHFLFQRAMKISRTPSPHDITRKRAEKEEGGKGKFCQIGEVAKLKSKKCSVP
jgi:hypothetical protein